MFDDWGWCHVCEEETTLDNGTTQTCCEEHVKWLCNECRALGCCPRWEADQEVDV